MPTTYETIRVFISSPKDVKEERDIAARVIKDISGTCKETLGIELECVSWDAFPPVTPRLPKERIQDKLNAEIKKCQIFLLILWNRYGSTEKGKSKSNTERETEVALDLLRTEKTIMFLSYFRDLAATEDAGPQRKSVEDFRNMLQNEGVWFKRYASVPDFQELITHDLYLQIMKSRLSTKKHAALRKYWLLGTPDRPTYPNLAIIYPSMGRTFMGPLDDPDVWLNRLEPNMVFEDVKALQKIERTLRLLGFSSFRIYNSAMIPSDIRFMNRFWICLPRNPRAVQQLLRYEGTARFEVVPRRHRADSYFFWKTAGAASERFVVRSPLARYLREQRSQMKIDGDWHSQMDGIVAKDFAILARFRDDGSRVAMQDHHLLQDYFLSGIRGLGTWGAAWFVDRQYQVFDNINEGKDFQFLLEVEYRDGGIFDVRDVSDMPKAYFDAENSLTTIRRNIRTYRAAPLDGVRRVTAAVR